VDLNDSGSDHQLAIDNVTFTAVPEPGPVLLGGLGLLALLRRRRIG
jgi:MYXO-CTERM domain-containing protein